MKRLESATNDYNNIVNQTRNKSISLYKRRKDASGLIKDIENLINTLANSPKEFKADFDQIRLNTKEFNRIADLELENKMAHKIGGRVAGTGVATGIGVAALAPSAAMAIATTFGTASTGAAISGLTGAAATNAALAWLGGGALAAGGGGMASGQALLALAGPVGWVIGGAALVGGGFIFSSKNREIAEKAYDEAAEIIDRTPGIRAILCEVNEILKLTIAHTSKLREHMVRTMDFPKNYLEFTDDQKLELGVAASA